MQRLKNDRGEPGFISSREGSGLGDAVHAALATVGITPGAVEAWLGGPCGCKERQDKLNALGRWAWRVAGGKVAGALGYLRAIMGETTDDATR